MTKPIKSNKTALTLFVLGLLFLSMIGGALAFPSSVLGSAAQTPGVGTLSVAGQSRSCSEYADETGVFTGAKTINSKSYPALINIYSCKNNDPTCQSGWSYIGEYTAPKAFSGGSKYFAYEIYYCPVDPVVCSNGQKIAATETSYRVCSNGVYSAPISCGGSYFSPQTQSCVSYACHEQWSCGSFGQCNADGKQYRSCTDAKSCGTFTDKPESVRTCTPPVASNTGSGLELVGRPTLDVYEGLPNAPRTVTQKFKVNTPGQYWIEAGIEQYRGFSIVADVEQNTCDPDEPWYANELVTFSSTGEVTKTFTVTPSATGEWVLHTAIVTGCGGTVLKDQVAVDRLIVTNTPDVSGTTGDNGTSGGQQHMGWPVWIGIIGVAALLIAYAASRGKK